MAHHAQRFTVAGGQNPQGNLAFLGKRYIEADNRAVNLRSQRGLCQARADIRGHIASRDDLVKLLFRTVGESYREHGRNFFREGQLRKQPSIQRTTRTNFQCRAGGKYKGERQSRRPQPGRPGHPRKAIVKITKNQVSRVDDPAPCGSYSCMKRVTFE